MAKQEEPNRQATTGEKGPRKVRLNAWVDKAFHQRVRIQAAVNGQAIQELVVAAVEAYLPETKA